MLLRKKSFILVIMFIRGANMTFGAVQFTGTAKNDLLWLTTAKNSNRCRTTLFFDQERAHLIVCRDVPVYPSEVLAKAGGTSLQRTEMYLNRCCSIHS